MEVRKFRNLSKKLVKIEERSKLMERLMARNVGFKDLEEFVLREKNKRGILKKGGEGIVDQLMKEKFRDNN